jgi:PPOX class probable F420-dependent enzyme
MPLDRPQCAALLAAAGHGVLATVHARRGVDAVPVCFATEADALVVPIDTVKPKSSSDLQRARNLDDDGRAVLLCEHWDPDDWSRLWWVRAHLSRTELDPGSRDRLEGLLTEKYPQYRDRPFAGLLTFLITEIHGWSGDPGDGPSERENREERGRDV